MKLGVTVARTTDAGAGEEPSQGRCMRRCGCVWDRSLFARWAVEGAGAMDRGDARGDCAPKQDAPALASRRGLWYWAARGVAGDAGADMCKVLGVPSAFELPALAACWLVPRVLCGLPCMRCLMCRNPARMPAHKVWRQGSCM